MIFFKFSNICMSDKTALIQDFSFPQMSFAVLFCINFIGSHLLLNAYCPIETKTGCYSSSCIKFISKHICKTAEPEGTGYFESRTTKRSENVWDHTRGKYGKIVITEIKLWSFTNFYCKCVIIAELSYTNSIYRNCMHSLGGLLGEKYQMTQKRIPA